MSKDREATLRSELDIAGNRRARKWSLSELFGRAVWEFVRFPLFALSPRPLWGWRRALLRLFGAKIGQHAHIHPSVRVAIPWKIVLGEYSSVGDRAILYSLGRITIGAQVTISQQAHICAGSHDFRSRSMELLKPGINIEDGAWVCADAYIGPGVTVARNAVVGARAVVTRSVGEHEIVAGNPAQSIGKRDLS